MKKTRKIISAFFDSGWGCLRCEGLFLAMRNLAALKDAIGTGGEGIRRENLPGALPLLTSLTATDSVSTEYRGQNESTKPRYVVVRTVGKGIVVRVVM